jgi:hypothetical protein
LRQYARETFLQPYGFQEGVTPQGRLTVVRQTDTTPSFFARAVRNTVQAQTTDRLVQTDGDGDTTDRIEVQIGLEALDDDATLTVSARDDADQRADGGKDLTVDLSTLPSDREAEARAIASSLLLFGTIAIPMVKIRAPDHLVDGLDYTIGAAVTLDEVDISPEWLHDEDGTRVRAIPSEPEWSGYLVSRKFRPRQQDYELDILLTGRSLVRLRTPAIEITGATGDELTVDTVSAVYPISDVSEWFTVGDVIQVWWPDMALWDSAPRRITELPDDETIVVDSAWSADPPSGTFVEIAHVDSDDSGTGDDGQGYASTLTGIDRAWVYLSDLEQTLGDAELDADRYGAG